MADEQQLALLRQGAEAWNKWRSANSQIRPDLAGANLRAAELRMVHLQGADLRGANLERADLTDADLRDADLAGARLVFAIIYRADARRARLNSADLTGADLRSTDLCGTDLEHAIMTEVDVFGAVYSTFTRFPVGFHPIEAGAKREHDIARKRHISSKSAKAGR